jgi:hypothetical protein
MVMGFFDVSIDTAKQFYAWGWRASVAGALVTTFGVGFLFWGTRVRDRDFESQIATLHDRAATSEERSKELEKGNLTLRRDIEREQTERLKIEERLKPRTINPNQEETIIALLSHAPKGKLYVVGAFLDGTDAKPFAKRISEVLEKSGFTVSEADGEIKQIIGFDRAGAWLWVNDINRTPPHARPIQDARAGLKNLNRTISGVSA